MVAGVFCGSMGWWLVLVTLVGGVRERVGERVLTWVTRVSGAAIAVFGVLAMWAGVVGLAGWGGVGGWYAESRGLRCYVDR